MRTNRTKIATKICVKSRWFWVGVPLFQNVNLRPPKEAIAATATHLCVQKEQNKATKPPI